MKSNVKGASVEYQLGDVEFGVGLQLLWDFSGVFGVLPKWFGFGVGLAAACAEKPWWSFGGLSCLVE